MRVPEPGSDVEPEVLAVLYQILSQPEVLHSSLLEGLFEKQWLQQWVQLLSNVLQEYWSAELYAVLKCAGIVGVRELDH